MPTFGDLHNDLGFDPPRPPDCGTGLLLRDDKPGESCGFIRDLRGFMQPDRDEIELALKEDVDQSYLIEHIYNQDGVGSCAKEQTDQGVSTMGAQEFGLHILYNSWPGYNEITGGRDNGSSLPANLRFARDFKNGVGGCVPDVDWPRYRPDGRVHHKWNEQVPGEVWDRAKLHRIDEFWEIGNSMEFRAALARGFVVGWGYTGHSILAVGLKDYNTIKYVNSWGNWGDKGYGYMSMSRVYWGYGVFGWKSRVHPGHAEIARLKKAQADRVRRAAERLGHAA
jgi:hypothetical protein